MEVSAPNLSRTLPAISPVFICPNATDAPSVPQPLSYPCPVGVLRSLALAPHGAAHFGWSGCGSRHSFARAARPIGLAEIAVAARSVTLAQLRSRSGEFGAAAVAARGAVDRDCADLAASQGEHRAPDVSARKE
jgi:hypothetical protein